MALLAGGELDAAVGADVIGADGAGLRLDHRAVDARATAADEPPRCAAGFAEARRLKQHDRGDAGFQVAPGGVDDGQVRPRRAFLEGPARGLGGVGGGLGAVTEGRRLVRQQLLGFVQLRAFQRLVARDLVEGKLGEEPHEAADIGVVGVAPVLPVVVGQRGGLR